MGLSALLLLLGTGLCLNNSRAIWQALTGRSGEFLRTPKFQVSSPHDQWQQSSYRLPLHPQLVAEAVLMGYALFAIGVAIFHGNYWPVPFLGIYAAGFALVVAVELVQSRPVRAWRRDDASAHRLEPGVDRP